jgi:hypothetical protein
LRAGRKPNATPIRVEQANADDRGGGEQHLEVAGEAADHRAQQQGQADAEHAAEQAHQHRFDQELLADVALPRTHGHAHADLAGALGHRHQHDVHHADAADQQRDGGDGADQQGHRARGLLDGLADLGAVAEEEVLGAVAQGQQAGDRFLRRIHRRVVVHAHGDAGHVALAEHARHHRGVGHPHAEAGAATEAEALALGHADHACRHVAEQDHLADRIDIGEELGLGVLVDHRHLAQALHRIGIEEAAAEQGHALDPEELLADAADLGGGTGCGSAR